MRNTRFILPVILLWSLTVTARELPCDTDANPAVCEFLSHYINEVRTWSSPDVSVVRKMRDDKFLILDGSLDNVDRMNDSTSFSLIRYEDKSYEAIWKDGNKVLLQVAFPIQYELILGLPQNEIEQHLQEHIMSAQPIIANDDAPLVTVESIAPNVYRSVPKRHYQLPALNNCQYFYKDKSGVLKHICDTAQIEYTIANLFQNGLAKDYLMQVRQKVYGFKHLDYTISLQQWLNYCAAEKMTCYVAIEEITEETIQVLIVAENKDLAYNHLLSVLVPRVLLNRKKGTMLVKLNAFIPTHNITDMYEQYTTKPKNQREWLNE